MELGMIGLGRMGAPQAAQWATTTQASCGMVWVVRSRHCGQVRVDVS